MTDRKQLVVWWAKRRTQAAEQTDVRRCEGRVSK